jgi:hypothetical protein
MNIFELVNYKQDISTVLPLKLLCKKWSQVFFDSTLSRATILNTKSTKWYYL